jgi:hypothetical protein
MASERQTEANRRNAAKSTGPRSGPGKKRASRNAHRHGLSLRISGAESIRRLEVRARRIAGDARHPISLECAHTIAEAEFEIARVRRVRVALIERAAAFGRFDVPSLFASPKDELAAIVLHYCDLTLWEGRPKLVIHDLPAMPSQEPERTAEAVRRIIDELRRLDRYEGRAIARRDRAIRASVRSKKIMIGSEII